MFTIARVSGQGRRKRRERSLRPPHSALSPQGPPEPLVKVGEPLPSVVLNKLVDGKIEKLTLQDFFGSKKGVLVSIPGAFTPG